MAESYEELHKAVMQIWSRIYDARHHQRGVRLSFRDIQLLAVIDGNVMQRLQDVEKLREDEDNDG